MSITLSLPDFFFDEKWLRNKEGNFNKIVTTFYEALAMCQALT
jgi:hypothetical protein